MQGNPPVTGCPQAIARHHLYAPGVSRGPAGFGPAGSMIEGKRSGHGLRARIGFILEKERSFRLPRPGAPFQDMSHSVMTRSRNGESRAPEAHGAARLIGPLPPG